eukprot:gnl/MRDRNA2_/MRDRNA2_88639_c0_seq1.p1 gnl/MRDRNA2_/MRDRNA2_88639_c0~~gnl/MRDRNA2_/MRDRNA2_88639_c0_seq1.p1  ORF type:complete len:172 (-),score=30.09 gnl/MRDRNA2_/MRDRNA2_88639_c0_seq1:97-612(-)
MNPCSFVLLLGTAVFAHSGLRNPTLPSVSTSGTKKSLVATNVAKVAKQPVDVKSLNNELKELDGHMQDGKYVVPSDTNYKTDQSATGDWGNEYGPAPKEVSTAQKKDPPDTEHVDMETQGEDWRGEYENPQTETRWKGRVGDTDYYREKKSNAIPCVASFGTLALAFLLSF